MTLIEQALARIAEMEKRAEKATPGPWDSQGIDIFTTDKRASVRIPWEGHIGEFGGGRSPEEGSRNAAFTCAARTDLPALCALVKALIAYFDMPGSRHPSEIQYIEAETVAAIKAFTEAKATPLSLPDRELDARLRDALRTPEHRTECRCVGCMRHVPAYSSPSSPRSLLDSVEAEIRKRGLCDEYVIAISELRVHEVCETDCDECHDWLLTTAPAKVRTAAAVAVLEAA